LGLLNLFVHLNLKLLFKNLLFLLLVVVLFSCTDKQENDNQITWIGGQIINPKLDYIVFSKGGNEILDTVKLDSNNFFLFKTDKITSGLYNLKHNETQVFYIEPGDSLLIHVNTLDFDESLAYSGRGGKKNNFLMYLYLTNETENLNLPNWYQLSSTKFTRKIDSLKELKYKEYKAFTSNNKVADAFKKAAIANIEYDYFIKKEKYAAANRNNPEKLDANFFDYRKEINFNLDEFNFYYPYYRFMNRYFENLTFAQFDSTAVVDRNSFDFNNKKIEIIDRIVTSDTLKNSLLRYNAMWYLLNAKDAAEERRFFENFANLNTDSNQVEELRQIFNITVKLTAGNTIPNVDLVNTDNVVQDLLSVVKAPTVIYFWSGASKSQFKNINNRAAELKSKYPEYTFLGINTDTHFKKWRQTIAKMGYNPDNQYQIENLNDAEKRLLVRFKNSALIVNKKGVILEGKTNLFNANFEQLLLGYLNQ
tara:strand:+ start:78954 stop:80387 length:1434 start_codon:yes stop_codon:yes gene_type:complete